MPGTIPPYTAAPVPRRSLLLLTLAMEGGMLVAAAGLGLLLRAPFWTTARLTVPDLLLGAACGVLMLPAATAILATNLSFAVRLRRDIDQLMPVFDNATFLDFLFISLIAGAGEEALFRGVLQPLAAGYLGVPVALVLVSLLFGAAHCISPAYVSFAAALGLVFGALQAWSGNIALPIVAHAVYDFAALVYGVRWDNFRRRMEP